MCNQVFADPEGFSKKKRNKRQIFYVIVIYRLSRLLSLEF